jgi:hypothetical protein
VNGGERVDLLHVYGRRTVARWRYRAEHGAHDEHLALGWLPDGRWWVSLTSEHRGWIYTDERDAWTLAEQLRAQPRRSPGTWVEVIAEYEPGVLPPRAAAVPRYPPGAAPITP